MKRALLILLFIFSSASVHAQTLILLPASQFVWSDAEHNALGLDGTPVVSNYVIELYLTTQVTGGVPSGTPVTVNLGKPTQAANGEILSTPIIPMLPALNTAYFGFLRAIGPGGTSPRSSAVGPFGAQGVPGAPVPKGTGTRPPS